MSQLKDIALWDEEYIAGLQVGEPDWLDFKQSEWLSLNNECFDKLSKYVSAFANYEGGYLVVGVKNPKEGQPLEIDGGVPLSLKPKLKDWLEDKIPNFVEERLSAIGVQLITASAAGSKIKSGHCLVVIHIPESVSAPHQATDRKYYSRLGSKLEPLKHRAVLDILGRRKHPEIKLVMLKLNLSQIGKGSFVFARLENVSSVLARHVMIVVDLPMQVGSFHLYCSPSQGTYNHGDNEAAFWRLNAGTTGMSGPLFPRGTIGLKMPFDYGQPEQPHANQLEHIRYRIYADEMPFVEGTFKTEEVTNWFVGS